MASKKPIDLEKLGDLNNDEIFDYIDGIDDEQAIDSDLGGDSDAEDVVHNDCFLPCPRGTKRLRSQDEISDFGSDDSIADPDFNPKPQRRTLAHFSTDDEDKRDENLEPEPSKTASSAKNNPPGIHFEFEWEKNPAFTNPFHADTFAEPFGSKVGGESPMDLFINIFGENLLNLIVTESNSYAQQNGTSLEMTIEELKAFVGVLIIMGFHSLPSLRLYWSSDENFHCARITEVMTLKRFLKLLRHLHLNDNQKMPKKGEVGFDKLYKIRPMINQLSSSFLNSYNPSRTVDESMVAFKGRTHLKQYMPQKPIKRGFKVWALACSQTGYLLNFSVYEGKKQSEEEGLLGEKTVLELTHPFEGKHYCVYFDNFFTSFPLLLKLLDRKLYGCGTVRINRKHFPAKFLVPDKQLQGAESDSVGTGSITVSKWKDRGKKCVVVASTFHSVSDMSSVKRMTEEGSKVTVNCPKSIEDYNKNMGGVDLFDQLHSCYNIAWKSRRWWLKLLYYFVDDSIVNSYILYKTNVMQHQPNVKPKSHLMFRSILANQLIGQFSSRKQKGSWLVIAKNKIKNIDGRAVTVENSVRLTNVGDHMPAKTTSRRCGRCSTEKNPKRCNVECTKCKVALCIPCFSPFHNQ